MAKVNANHFACLRINHEVGKMPVADTEDVLADGELGMRDSEVALQSKERF